MVIKVFFNKNVFNLGKNIVTCFIVADSSKPCISIVNHEQNALKKFPVFKCFL